MMHVIIKKKTIYKFKVKQGYPRKHYTKADICRGALSTSEESIK